MGFLINRTNDLIRRNPFNDLERMHRHMNHLLDFALPGLGGHDTSFLEGYRVPAIEPNRLNARFNNGVLELTIAKKEESMPKQVKNNVA